MLQSIAMLGSNTTPQKPSGRWRSGYKPGFYFYGGLLFDASSEGHGGGGGGGHLVLVAGGGRTTWTFVV